MAPDKKTDAERGAFCKHKSDEAEPQNTQLKRDRLDKEKAQKKALQDKKAKATTDKDAAAAQLPAGTDEPQEAIVMGKINQSYRKYLFAFFSKDAPNHLLATDFTIPVASAAVLLCFKHRLEHKEL